MPVMIWLTNLNSIFKILQKKKPNTLTGEAKLKKKTIKLKKGKEKKSKKKTKNGHNKHDRNIHFMHVSNELHATIRQPNEQ